MARIIKFSRPTPSRKPSYRRASRPRQRLSEGQQERQKISEEMNIAANAINLSSQAMMHPLISLIVREARDAGKKKEWEEMYGKKEGYEGVKVGAEGDVVSAPTPTPSADPYADLLDARRRLREAGGSEETVSRLDSMISRAKGRKETPAPALYDREGNPLRGAFGSAAKPPGPAPLPSKEAALALPQRDPRRQAYQQWWDDTVAYRDAKKSQGEGFVAESIEDVGTAATSALERALRVGEGADMATSARAGKRAGVRAARETFMRSLTEGQRDPAAEWIVRNAIPSPLPAPENEDDAKQAMLDSTYAGLANMLDKSVNARLAGKDLEPFQLVQGKNGRLVVSAPDKAAIELVRQSPVLNNAMQAISDAVSEVNSSLVSAKTKPSRQKILAKKLKLTFGQDLRDASEQEMLERTLEIFELREESKYLPTPTEIAPNFTALLSVARSGPHSPETKAKLHQALRMLPGIHPAGIEKVGFLAYLQGEDNWLRPYRKELNQAFKEGDQVGKSDEEAMLAIYESLFATRKVQRGEDLAKLNIEGKKITNQINQMRLDTARRKSTPSKGGKNPLRRLGRYQKRIKSSYTALGKPPSSAAVNKAKATMAAAEEKYPGMGAWRMAQTAELQAFAEAFLDDRAGVTYLFDVRDDLGKNPLKVFSQSANPVKSVEGEKAEERKERLDGIWANAKLLAQEIMDYDKGFTSYRSARDTIAGSKLSQGDVSRLREDGRLIDAIINSLAMSFKSATGAKRAEIGKKINDVLDIVERKLPYEESASIYGEWKEAHTGLFPETGN